MKKVLNWIKEHLPKWMNLNHQQPWQKETHTWEDTAPSEYEPND